MIDLRQYRRFAYLLIMFVLLSSIHSVPTHAATEVTYVAQTGHYMRGGFRDFWDKHSGIANFGYPITEEYIDPKTGRIFQYFERSRFERDQNGTTIQIGKVGSEVAGDRRFETHPPIKNSRQRRYFPETRHIVQYGFKQVWETRGGLEIFGLPLSNELEEYLTDGQLHTIQYFEKARFEYWPDLPDGKRVLLSALGQQLAPKELTAPLPPNAPPPGPITVGASQPAGKPPIPAGKNARVIPESGPRGQAFLFQADGFEPGELVSIWLNFADGAVAGASFQVNADDKGTINGEEIFYQSGPKDPTGIWSFVGHGVSSGHESVGYFLLEEGSTPPGGAQPNVNARVDPPSGPTGTTFTFDAYGFQPDEDVVLLVIAPTGERIEADFTVPADENGSIGYAQVYLETGPDWPRGVYTFMATGAQSGRVAKAYFEIT